MPDVAALQAFLDRVPVLRQAGAGASAMRPLPVPAIDIGIGPRDLDPDGLRQDPRRSVQGRQRLADRIVTTSPDVTGTTNLGPWVNRRKLFAREAQADTFMDENIPSTAKWEFAPEGQHIELGIAEMNLFLLLGAAGLSHSPVRQAADPDRHGL